MKKTLIIFDIDGTLLFSNKVDSQCFADTYESIYEQPFPTIDWRRYPHVTDDTIFSTVIRDQFGREVTESEVIDFKNQFVGKIAYKRVRNPELFEEVPGAVSMIEYLQAEKEIVLGIGTGGWKQPAMVKLKHLGFDLTDMYMGFADGNATREMIVEEAIQSARTAHADIERMVYVGDAVWDVKTTRNMGLPFIGIRRNRDVEVLEKEGANYVLSDYLDDEKFLEYVAIAKSPRK